MNKKPGAVSQQHTQVIWVKMINRPVPADRLRGNVLSLRNKFNYILEEALAKRNGKILSIESLIAADFDRNFDLTTYGRIQFLKELDHFAKKFDREDCALNAIPAQDDEYCLPMPPGWKDRRYRKWEK